MTIKTPNAKYGYNNLYVYYKSKAEKRNLEFNIDRDSFFSLLSKPCHYCGSPPSNQQLVRGRKITYTGIDRTDNGVGYVSGNVVSCCIDCNRAKMKRSYNEFVIWVKRVYSHLDLQNSSHDI